MYVKRFDLMRCVPADFTGKAITNKGECYYRDGKLHRENEPAIVYRNGNKIWYLDGKLHRLNGPAIDHVSGFKSWFINGLAHRIDGPCSEYCNGAKRWCIEGKSYSEQEYWNQIDNMISKNRQVFNSSADRPSHFTGISIILDMEHWFLNGQKHRVNGPAVSWPNHKEYWLLNTMLDQQEHKGRCETGIYIVNPTTRFAALVDVPKDFTGIAEVYNTKYWMLNGVKHKLNGPAVKIGAYEEYWVNGCQFKKSDFDRIYGINGVRPEQEIIKPEVEKELKTQADNKGCEMTFTEEQKRIAQRIYDPENQALQTYCHLIYHLEWNKNPNARVIRKELDKLMQLSGQASDAFRYCNALYNKQYCTCGIKDCPDKDQHMIKTTSRTNCGYESSYYMGVE